MKPKLRTALSNFSQIVGRLDHLGQKTGGGPRCLRTCSIRVLGTLRRSMISPAVAQYLSSFLGRIGQTQVRHQLAQPLGINLIAVLIVTRNDFLLGRFL